MKPKKTLKELSRLEKLLSKQTARSAKLLARRKKADDENPVTVGYYDRIAAQHASALVDLSEITALSESLTLQLVEADADKAARKDADKRDGKKAKSAKGQNAKAGDAALAPDDKMAAKSVAKMPTVRAAKTAAKPSAKPASKAASEQV